MGLRNRHTLVALTALNILGRTWGLALLAAVTGLTTAKTNQLCSGSEESKNLLATSKLVWTRVRAVTNTVSSAIAVVALNLGTIGVLLSLLWARSGGVAELLTV